MVTIKFPYSPDFPIWRVALQAGYPAPNKFPIRDVLLVACGINPENCGHKPNDPDLYVSAVGWKSAGLPTDYLAPKAFQKKTPGKSGVKHSPMIYTKVSGLAPEYSRMVEWAVGKYGEPLTDQVAGIDVLQGLKAAGFKVHEWFDPLVSHVPVVAPVKPVTIDYDDPQFYLPTTEMLKLLRLIFQERDFGYLSRMSDEELEKKLASARQGAWLDITKKPAFANDLRMATAFIKGKRGRPGKAKGMENQSRRHFFWTLLALAIRKHKDREKIIAAFKEILPSSNGVSNMRLSTPVHTEINLKWFPPESAVQFSPARKNWARWFRNHIDCYAEADD